MGLFDGITNIFKRNRESKISKEFIESIVSYSPGFTTWSGSINEALLIRSVIHAKAKHTAKLTANITGSALSSFEKTLKHRPNPLQSSYDFLYSLRTIYEMDTHVFILPVLSDDLMKVVGLFPAKSKDCQLVETDEGNFIRYKLSNGRWAAIEYEYVGVMSKMNYKNFLFGDGNAVLRETMSLLHLQNQGIEEAIKKSAEIRFLAKIGQNLHPDDLEKERERFTEKNLSSENKSGLLLFDTKYDEVKQIDSKPYVVDDKQLSFIKENVYSYFGVNEDILQNKFNEDVWNAFYEGEIEPFAIQLSQAMTNILFTEHEVAHGNQVHYSANRLQYASNKMKLEVSRSLFDRGIFGTDDVAEIWNLPKTGNNKKYIRKEYAAMSEIDEDGDVVLKTKEEEGENDNK